MSIQRTNTLFRVVNAKECGLDETATLGILEHLDKDTLQSLDDSEDKLQELINDQQQVKNLEQDKEMLIASNKSLAEYNLKLRPKLNQGREILAIIYEKAHCLKDEYDKLRALLASKNERPCLDTVHALLQTKVAQREEEADQVGDRLLECNADLDTLIEQYIEKRSNAHMLKIKEEKLEEMIKHMPVGNGQPSTTAPVQQRWPGSPNPAPYPTYTATGMPMPAHYLPNVSN